MTLEEDFIQQIKNIFPTARVASGGKELQCNCPYCGDKDKKFYISIPTDNKPALFNCFHARCQRHGIVTSNILAEWGIYDINLNIGLTQYNNAVMKLPINNKYNNTQSYKLTNYYISKSENSEIKLNYINTRLGLHLTYQDLLENKIVLNLYDLLATNHISDLTRSEYITNQLDSMFLGFISEDNAFINMRNLNEGQVHPSIAKRYVNYDIFGKYDNTHRFYAIPCSIDITQPVVLRLAEGCFDILSVKYNVVQDHHNTIFAAICGASYSNLIRYFITTYGFINLDIHIYKDNDVNDWLFNDIKRLKQLGYRIWIHYNSKAGEKDFGVARECIIDTTYKL